MIDRYVVISTDTHAGADLYDYKEYLPARLHDDFDAWAKTYISPFDDLIIASGHVFGNAAGPTTGRLVTDLICGTEPAIDMTPFRADRPSLTPVAAGATW